MVVKLSKELIAAAQKAQVDWGVPASVTLAQYGLESGWGVHVPLGSFNPFGIKASGRQAYVTAGTVEVVHGKRVKVTARFRKFASWAEAFDEHGKLLNRPQYAHAMLLWTMSGNVERYVRLLAATYATDPQYASKLLSLIDSNDLNQYNLATHQKGAKA